MNHENDDTSPIEIDTDDEVINEDTNYAGGNNIDIANARMDDANYRKLKRHLIKITDTQKQIDDLDTVDRTFMIRMKEQERSLKHKVNLCLRDSKHQIKM